MSDSIDADRLSCRFREYAELNGVCKALQQEMDALLQSDVGKLVLDSSDLFSILLSDAYKAKMHKMYAIYLGEAEDGDGNYKGVHLDFALNVRGTPIELGVIQADYPDAFNRMLIRQQKVSSTNPYPDRVLAVLREYFNFEAPQVGVTTAAL